METQETQEKNMDRQEHANGIRLDHIKRRRWKMK